LLKLEHIPLYFLPGNPVPSIHRGCGPRVHSILASCRTSTFHVTVPPSAYPLAFPEAFASETILPPFLIRLTPAPLVHTRVSYQGESRRGSYSVPGYRLPLRVGSHCSPGYLWDAVWIKRRVVQPERGEPSRFSMSILDQADNPRRLVAHDDDS